MVVFQIKTVSDLVVILMFVINSSLPVRFAVTVIKVLINFSEDWLNNDHIDLVTIRVDHFLAVLVVYLKLDCYGIEKLIKVQVCIKIVHSVQDTD